MTYNNLIRKFVQAFPSAEIDDYRPVCHELFEEGRVGITIWLKNGDMVVYYPKQSEGADKWPMRIKFTKDFANNWKAGSIVKAEYVSEDKVCVDGAATVDAKELMKHCEIISESEDV